MPVLTGRRPQRRHKSSRLYPDVAAEKSRQPVMKLAAAQTNRIKVQSAVKSDKSSCYQLSLSPEASHGASQESTSYLSWSTISHFLCAQDFICPCVLDGGVNGCNWRRRGCVRPASPLLSVYARLHLWDQSSFLVPVILHHFHPAAPLLDQPTTASLGFSALVSEDHFPHQETHL